MTLNRILHVTTSLLALVVMITYLTGCGKYSFTGGNSNAKNISISEFYNNSDLGPANMGQTFSNSLKNYLIQNSNLSVVQQDGELQMEGEISGFTLMPIAPVASGDPNAITPASLTRLTITVKVTYVNTLDETMSFKDKSFSFYNDFPNEKNLSDVQDALIRVIYERIIMDIFNASVANW